MTRANSGFWADFRKFISQGNVVDLAVAVVIGGAFGKIVESLVADIITPAILSPALSAMGAKDLAQLSYNGIKYGVFLAAVINFLVIAFSIFIVIRAFERTKRKLARQSDAEDAAPIDPAVAAQERTTAALDRLSRALESRSL